VIAAPGSPGRVALPSDRGHVNPSAARALAKGAAHIGVALDDDSLRRIDTYLAVLDTWSRHTRLTGERDPEAVVRKHVVDSLAVVPKLPRSGLIVDIGSGAGFPGMVLACVRPDLDFVLVDARRRRVSFLREAGREAGLLRVAAVEARAEDLATRSGVAGAASVVIARAVRPDVFLPLARPLAAPAGTIVAMQTASAVSTATAEAEAHELRVNELHEYTLPGGERRVLVLYRLFPGKPVP
jgi:16S rRNA (guanine527-N7)-methyltransferase